MRLRTRRCRCHSAGCDPNRHKAALDLVALNCRRQKLASPGEKLTSLFRDPFLSVVVHHPCSIPKSVFKNPLEPCFMFDPLMTSFTHRSHTPVVASIAPAQAPLLRRYPRISGKLLKFGSSSSVIISWIKSPSGSSVSSALASHPLKPLFLSPFPL